MCICICAHKSSFLCTWNCRRRKTGILADVKTDRQKDGRTIRQTGRRAERNDQPSPVATEDQGPKEPRDHGLGPGVGQVQSGRVQAQAQAQAQAQKQQAQLQP